MIHRFPISNDVIVVTTDLHYEIDPQWLINTKIDSSATAAALSRRFLAGYRDSCESL